MSQDVSTSIHRKWNHPSEHYSPTVKAFLCRYCGFSTKSPLEMKRHLAEPCKPATQPTPAVKQKAQVQRTAREGFVRCEECGSELKPRNRQRHFAKVHPSLEKAGSSPAIVYSDSRLPTARALDSDLETVPSNTGTVPAPRNAQRTARYKPCSCGGSNDNCLRCFGSGQVRAGSGGSISRAAKRVGASHAGDAVTVHKCEECSFTGTSVELLHHRQAVHPKTERYVGKKSKRKISPNQLLPPVGSAFTRTIAQAREKSARDKQKLLKQQGRCDLCGRTVKNLARHRRLDHLSTKAKKPKSGHSTLDRWKEELQQKQSLHQPNLDATKGYAHPYRESGKFGSHPSHDGFDDESGS